MIDVKKISFDVKTGIVFGILALLLSFFTGIFSGIGLKSVLLRTFIMVAVFSVLGFAVVFVLKKYVPEFYELLSGSFSAQGAGEGKGDSAESDGQPAGDISPDQTYTREGGVMGAGEGMDEAHDVGGEFSELTEKSFPRYETISDNDLEPAANVSLGKMGKHIIEKEKVVKYEPKLMAEAIRTMMSRDKD